MNYKQLRNCIFVLAILLSVSPYGWAASFSTLSPPQNMGTNINAADMDQTPAPASSGLSLYFTSSRTAGGQGGNDIWVSQRTTLSSAWGAAQNLGAILNTISNDTVTNISPDGREMFFTSNRAGGSGGPDLYVSTRTDPNNDFGWTTPVNLGGVINSTLQDVGGVYFVEPATGNGSLFFWSDRAETGLGNIYQSMRNADGTFNTPALVNELNSAASERGIAISRDGLEMFISSTRLSATSVFSIFVSTRASVSAPWNPPVPVGGLNAGGNASQPALSPDGTVLYLVSSRTGTLGSGDLYSSVRVNVSRTPTADFDGDGRTDLSVFRPGTSTWYVMQSSDNTFRTRTFGITGDKIVPGDYDGDGRADIAVFRPSEGNWYILSSSAESYFSVTTWGVSADDPAPGDYDGDGRTDIAVYREGTWYIVQSSNGQIRLQEWGVAGDIAIAAASGQ
jgi:hypothetical protein